MNRHNVLITAWVLGSLAVAMLITAGVTSLHTKYVAREERIATQYNEALEYQATVKAREPHQHTWTHMEYLAACQAGLGIVEVLRCPDCRQSAYVVLPQASSTATYRIVE